MKHVYYIEFSHETKESFITNVLSKFNVRVIDKCVTTPGLLRLQMREDQISKMLCHDSIKCIEPANIPIQPHIQYSPIEYHDVEDNFPNVGVQHPNSYLFWYTLNPLSPLSASQAYDTRDDFANSHIHYTDTSASLSGSTFGFKSNTFDQLPKSWGPWRMKVPKILNTEHNAALTASNLGTNLFTTEVTIDPVVLTSDTTGEIIEEEEVSTDVVGSVSRQDIPLITGFNIISTFIDIAGKNARDLLTGSLYNTTLDRYATPAEVTASDSPIELFKNNAAAIINFNQSATFNGIGDLSNEEGYQIKIANDGNDYELRISGSVLAAFSYTLNPGNYIMSFPSTVPIDPEILFAGQIDNINLIKNNAGQIFAPPNTSANNSDTLFNQFDGDVMNPGEGYQINVINDSVTISISNTVLQPDYSEVIEEIPVEIPGCTNAAADNYNPDATEDDGSCIIYGCTDPTAFNYNSAATHDDGTCSLPTAYSTEAQVIKLPPSNLSVGANIFLISTYKDLPKLAVGTGIDISIDNIFSQYLFKETDLANSTVNVVNIIQEIKDIRGGTQYIPIESFNGIGDMQPSRGYQVTMNPDRFNMFENGNAVRYELRIPGGNLLSYTFNLTAGFNQIGCPFSTEVDIPTIFAPIADKITIFKDNLGALWNPSMGFNGIGNMIPGHGYQIKVTQDVSLTVII